MTATGEPYVVARRQDTNEHDAAGITSVVSADDVRAAAEAHRELGPGYSDAVVAAFIEKVDKAVDARLEARLADTAQSKAARPAGLGRRLLTRRRARDVLAASAGALVAVGAIGLSSVSSAHAGPPNSLPKPILRDSRCFDLGAGGGKGGPRGGKQLPVRCISPFGP
jgi:hypothetical protein